MRRSSSRTNCRACRAWATSRTSASATTACGCGSIPSGWPRATCRPGTSSLAIQQQNTQVAAGQIGQPPVDNGQVFQFTVSTMGRLADPEEFAEMILKREPTGGLVRLKDVARIELGAQGYDQTCRLDGQPSVALSIYQLPGSNALEVAELVQGKDGGPENPVSRGNRLRDRLRHHAVYQRVDQRSVQGLARRDGAGGHRRAGVLAELAQRPSFR